MKKFYLSMLASFFCSIFAQAQITNFGFQTGLSFSNTSVKFGKDEFDTYPLAGLNTGVFLNIRLSNYLTFQPGINYVQKGYNYTFTYAPGEVTNEHVRIHYLELPVNLVYYSHPGQKGFFTEGGVTIGLGMGGKLKSSGNGETSENKIDFGINEGQLKRGDIGINMMFGYVLNNGLFAGLFVNLGLTNLSNMEGTEIRNNYFGMKIGFLLHTPKKSVVGNL